jgi:hypothetical protein
MRSGPDGSGGAEGKKVAVPRHDVYTLHIYRSRAVNGWQWVARLEHLPEGESLRFTDPGALLAYLASVLPAGGRSGPARDPLDGADVEVAGTQEGGAGLES